LRSQAADRSAVQGQLIDRDVVYASGAVDDHRVAGGRIAAVDSDLSQIGWRAGVVQVNRVAAGAGFNDQRDLVFKLDRLEVVDRHAPGRRAQDLSLRVVDGVVGIQQAGDPRRASDV